MEDRVPTILCVDDDPEILSILKEYLTRQGFDVRTATNGVEALFEVKRRPPKAVILDLFMPRPGGLVALERIKKLDPGMPILLVSGMPNVLEMIAEAGASVAGAFAKPLDLPEIVETLIRAGVVPFGAAPEGTPERLRSEIPPSTRRRVLVVDDEPDVRDLLVEYLWSKGFEAFGAGSGEEALRRFRECLPHVVLLDIVMPGVSGVETLRRIKSLPHEASVIVVSGKADVETLRTTLALGAADYVPKPVDFGYLDSVLNLQTSVSHG